MSVTFNQITTFVSSTQGGSFVGNVLRGLESGRSGLENLGKELTALGNALTRLADMLEGRGTTGTSPSTGTTTTTVSTSTGPGSLTDVNSERAKADAGQVIAGSARIWGDPHFIGADGGRYDVQGEAGKTYNLLSDSGFQMNGRFDQWGAAGSGLTVVGQVGITLDHNYVTINKDGTASVDGIDLKDGVTMQLGNGGYATKKGNFITVKSGEWEVKFEAVGHGNGSYLNMDIKTSNAVADGVKPHGLIGQTFDGDGKARNGDAGKGTQGGGAIEDLNGNIVARGNTSAVQLYEVAHVHDYKFANFNRDTRGLEWERAIMGGSAFNRTYGSAAGPALAAAGFEAVIAAISVQVNMVQMMGNQNLYSFLSPRQWA